MTVKKGMLINVLIGLVSAFLLVVAVAVFIHHYYFAWSDDLTKCASKTASSKRINQTANFATQKLEYFTAHKISYGFLRSDAFVTPIKNDPNYTVEYLSNDATAVLRNFNGAEYRINLVYVFRNYNPDDPDALVYDGAGVRYYVRENCGIPYYQIEKNLRKMIEELPVDRQLSAEMNEKLELEFFTDRNLIKLF